MSKGHKEALLELTRDRQLAHRVLFKHRHPLETPDFHGEIIDAFHGPDPKVVEEAFRSGGKSTIGEEATCLGAEFGDFANGLIVGATEDRAMERLEAVKHEIEHNDMMVELFGEQVGPTWQGRKIILQSDTCIQAIGVGQKVRGLKHLNFRPDWIWLDDIEDDESTKGPEASQARLRWLYKTLLPVCAKNSRVRLTGNRLSPDAVVTKLANDRAWKSYRYPICHMDILTGQEVPTWPALYDMNWIVETRDEYHRLGLDSEWASEYMCEATSEATKPFKAEHYRVVPRPRSWEPVQAIYDPAKTAKNLRHQSHYGKGVFSWIGRKLVIWECKAEPMMPSELIDDIFAVEKKYAPLSIHVEKDGLNEWLSEPLRTAQTTRRIIPPHLFEVSAPRDKIAFIRGLEPFFNSNEIEFAQECPEVRAHMLNFPAGRIDDLNVIAYALKLRPGQPIYTGFGGENVVDQVDISLRSKRYLCLNADGTFVTGALVQYDGALSVLGDWIEQGDPGQCLATIHKQALLCATTDIEIVVPPKELDRYQNKGVVAALRRIPLDCMNGNTQERGRAEIRDLLNLRSELPRFQVAKPATWTLRAMSGGYHKKVNSAGQPEEFAEDGAYKTLMEGLESFAGIMHHEARNDGTENTGIWRTGREGRPYRSLIGNRR